MRSLALSRLTVLVAALALFGQLMALPYHNPEGPAAPAEVAALLKATFGDAAVLCVTADDPATPAAPGHQHGHGDGDCPLCQFGAQTVLLSSPTPSLPERLDVAAEPLAPRADFLQETSKPTGLPQPRAPPLEV